MGTAIPYFYYNSSKKALDYFRANLTNLVDTIKSLNYDYKYPMPRYYKEKNPPFLKKAKSPGNGDNLVTADKASSASATVSQSMSGSESNSNGEPSQKSSGGADSITSIYWMLQDPVDEGKYAVNRSVAAQEGVTNRKVDQFNRESINLLYHSPINIWSSGRLVSQAYNRDSVDGINIGPFALEIVSGFLRQLLSFFNIT
jgi:hypothetical protein